MQKLGFLLRNHSLVVPFFFRPLNFYRGREHLTMNTDLWLLFSVLHCFKLFIHFFLVQKFL